MGVLGLWQLLDPTSRTIKIEGLEGKVIAVDISIWLYQATKGSTARNAHIIVLFNRICKLLYYKIKPIFVFDGPEVPALKRRILQERQKRRQISTNKTKELDVELQKNLLASIALAQIQGCKPSQNDLNALRAARDQPEEDGHEFDIFELKDLRKTEIETIYEKKKEENLDETEEVLEYPDLNDIDQDVFDSLPIDIQMELLTNYKETLKRNKGKNFVDFPEKSDDFSSYQLKMLLHKGEVTKKMHDLKESIKSSIANDMGVPFNSVIHQKIASEDDRDILYISKNTTENFTTFKNMLESEYGPKLTASAQSQVAPFAEQQSTSHLTTELILKKLHRNNSSDAKNSKDKDEDEIFVMLDEDITIVEHTEESKEVADLNDDVEIVAVEMSSKITPVVEKDKTSKTRVDTEVGFDTLKASLPVEMNLKRSSQEVVNTDVAGPKISRLDLTDNIVNVEHAAEAEIETDTDDDDFVEVIIPETNVFQNLVSSSNSTASNEVILIEDEDQEPTTSARSEAKTSELDAEIFIENEAMNLDEYNLYLEERKKAMLKEKQRESKLSSSIENYMIDDAMHLLQLFGLPYVVCPGEAEAQCAYFDLFGQTDGSITEDSDIWLFGANNVFKNFFNPNQYIEHFTSSLIKSQLGFDRETLICIAMLVGSDYTTGIEGVGVVKAVEILNEFEGEGMEKLVNFKNWHEKAKNSNAKQSKLRTSLKKLVLKDDFPSQIVHDAYTKPNVKQNYDKFNWSFPELDSIRKFLISRLSWNVKKIDDTLLPIMKRLNETKIQKTIDTYFAHNTVLSLSKQSKRMKNAINLFKTNNKPTKNNNQVLNLSENESDEDTNDDKEQHNNKNTQKTTSKLNPKQIANTKTSSRKRVNK